MGRMRVGIGLPAAVPETDTDVARADALTDAERIQAEPHRLLEAGCADVVLSPCSGDLEQASLLAQVLRAGGTTSGDHRVLQGAFPTTERGANE
jgi:hypothetical protein